MFRSLEKLKNLIQQKQDKRNRKNVSDDADRKGCQQIHPEELRHNQASPALKNREERDNETDQLGGHDMSQVIREPDGNCVRHRENSLLFHFMMGLQIRFQEVKQNVHLLVRPDRDPQIIVDPRAVKVPDNDTRPSERLKQIPCLRLLMPDKQKVRL